MKRKLLRMMERISMEQRQRDEANANLEIRQKYREFADEKGNLNRAIRTKTGTTRLW